MPSQEELGQRRGRWRLDPTQNLVLGFPQGSAAQKCEGEGTLSPGSHQAWDSVTLAKTIPLVQP